MWLPSLHEAQSFTAYIAYAYVFLNNGTNNFFYVSSTEKGCGSSLKYTCIMDKIRFQFIHASEIKKKWAYILVFQR